MKLLRLQKKQDAPIYRAESLLPEWSSGIIFLKKGSVQLNTTFREPVNTWNVAMVWKAVEILNDKFAVNEEQLAHSIESFKGAPGRFEKLHPGF